MLKAVIFGAILTTLVAMIVGSQGSSGGPLGVHSLSVADYRFFWSWSLFFAGSGLAWALILLQR